MSVTSARGASRSWIRSPVVPACPSMNTLVIVSMLLPFAAPRAPSPCRSCARSWIRCRKWVTTTLQRCTERRMIRKAPGDAGRRRNRERPASRIRHEPRIVPDHEAEPPGGPRLVQDREAEHHRRQCHDRGRTMGNIRERSASGRSVRDAHAARLERLPGRTSSCGSIRKTLRLSVCALAAGGLLHALPAQAVEFGSGGIQGSFDTTLSHGVTWRTGKRDDGLTGPNSDDGGRNYDRGIVSNTSKVTGELQIDHGNFGAFARFSGFIDFENQNGDRGHRPLSEEAKDLAGKNLEVLDLYVTGTFDAGEAPVDLRLGNHVLNWGESTFIQNGINVINPFDVTKLRTPGGGAARGAGAGPAVLGIRGADRRAVAGRLLPARLEEDRDRPAGHLFLDQRLRRRGREPGVSHRSRVHHHREPPHPHRQRRSHPRQLPVQPHRRGGRQCRPRGVLRDAPGNGLGMGLPRSSPHLCRSGLPAPLRPQLSQCGARAGPPPRRLGPVGDSPCATSPRT